MLLQIADVVLCRAEERDVNFVHGLYSSLPDDAAISSGEGSTQVGYFCTGRRLARTRYLYQRLLSGGRKVTVGGLSAWTTGSSMPSRTALPARPRSAVAAPMPSLPPSRPSAPASAATTCR